VFNASHASQPKLNEHLFDLAPSGVYLAACGSYRTISPLPFVRFHRNRILKNSNHEIAGTKPSMS